jgi:membrane-bound inhibitor of C-type lysozyme
MIFIAPMAAASPIADYQFKSPSLNGSGYGTFQMTIENEQYARQQAIQQALQSAAQAAQSASANTPINQFLTNLESRIYAQISQNVATAMFANGSSTSGQINFQGNVIYWTNTGTAIQLQVTDNVGNVTNVNVPLGSFNITGSAAQ